MKRRIRLVARISQGIRPVPNRPPAVELLETRVLLSGNAENLAEFDTTNGKTAQGQLVIDGSGNLYGTTVSGGANGLGVLFEIPAGTSSITDLASFDGTDGANPSGTIVEDSNGNLYGTTIGGGADGNGTVFELPAGSSSIVTLASFTSETSNNNAQLLVDKSGNLFGTELDGGTSNLGSIFEIPAGSPRKPLRSVPLPGGMVPAEQRRLFTAYARI